MSASVLLLAAALHAAPASPVVRGCCQRPLETAPRPPRLRSQCHGTLWSLAVPGRCQQEELGGGAMICKDGALYTAVTVREYTLTWNERVKECQLISSGKTAVATVPACDGNSC